MLMPSRFQDSLVKIMNFIIPRITEDYLSQYVHHWQVWAILEFIDRYLSVYDQGIIEGAELMKFKTR